MGGVQTGGIYFQPLKKGIYRLGAWTRLFDFTSYTIFLTAQSGFIMFERDVRMVEYARHYGVLDWIPEDRLDLVLQQSGCFSAEHGKRGYGLLCVSPEVYREEPEARRRLEDVYIAVCHAEEAAERQRAELLE